jgi:integrase
MSVFRRKYKDKKGHWKVAKTYRYEFSIGGKPYRGALPEARTKPQAERAETKIRDSVYEGKYGAVVQEIPTLRDFIKGTYLSWSKTNKRSWRHDEFRSQPLIQAMGQRRLDEIGVIQIERYKQDRLKQKSKRGTLMSPASINRELELLSGVFTYALACKILVPNPCQNVKRLDEDNDRNRYLSDDEEKRLMAQLVDRRAHLLPIVKLALLTLMRKREILHLRWANVDFARGVILVMNSRRERTKGKRSRIIPLNSEAKDILLALQKASGESEYVFPNPVTGKSYTDIKTAFTSACADAKVEDFWFHDLKRTGATRLGEAGADAFYIQYLCGHSDVKTSQIYTVATNEGLRRAVETLANRKPEKKETELKVVKA